MVPGHGAEVAVAEGVKFWPYIEHVFLFRVIAVCHPFIILTSS